MRMLNPSDDVLTYYLAYIHQKMLHYVINQHYTFHGDGAIVASWHDLLLYKNQLDDSFCV